VATEMIGGQPQELVYVGSTFTDCTPPNPPICPMPPASSFLAGYCTALGANNGTPVWQSQLLNPIGFSSPAVANGVVFCADLGTQTTNGQIVDGQIYAFDASGTGCLLPGGPPCVPLWQNDLGYAAVGVLPDLIGSPAVADGMIFETAGNYLIAFCVSGVDCP